MLKQKISKTMIVLASAAFLVACSESGNDATSGNTDKQTDITQLMHEAEEARAQADQLGFEWSVTKPLLDEGHAAYKAGDKEKAAKLFEEAKQQSLLAIEQAHYADKHWQLLVPGK